jgi:hypothetical protein
MNSNDPLLDFLGLYYHVEALGADYLGDFRRALASVRDQTRATKFKEQLATAIARCTLPRKEYERVTGQDLDSDEDLRAELRTLWGAPCRAPSRGSLE